MSIHSDSPRGLPDPIDTNTPTSSPGKNKVFGKSSPSTDKTGKVGRFTFSKEEVEASKGYYDSTEDPETTPSTPKTPSKPGYYDSTEGPDSPNTPKSPNPEEQPKRGYWDND